jgi:hypothetical protein
MDHKRWQETAVLVKGGGMILGRIVGLLLGGILGGRYGGVFWAIVGVISLYLIIGRVGAKISTVIGYQLDRIFSSTEKPDTDNAIRSARSNGLLFSIYGIVVPALFMVIALLLNNLAFSTSKYSEELPIARIVVIVLSLFSVFLPWLLRTRWMKSTTNVVARENAIFILGLGLSVAPVVYGFFLFIAFSASIIELGVFAVASSFVAIIWSANTKIKQQDAG